MDEILSEAVGQGILSELLALDRRCAELARAGAPEHEFRAAVTGFREGVREVRRLYRESRGSR